MLASGEAARGEAKMKALLCTELGSIEKLTVQDVPSPRPGPNQVVVDVKASSINTPSTANAMRSSSLVTGAIVTSRTTILGWR